MSYGIGLTRFILATALCACAADPASTGDRGNGGTGAGGALAGSGGAGGSTPIGGSGGVVTAGTGGGGMGGGSPQGCVSGEVGAAGVGAAPEFSYIWVANAAESTISKINTRTLVEEGRYITREDNNGNPSRTSVNLAGDVAVANRNGGVTKFYAQEEDCIDSNEDGVISTSRNAMPDIAATALPWAEEECRAWSRPLSYTSNRPIAWARGVQNPATCEYEGAKVWTSGANNCNSMACEIDVLRLNGDTGIVEDMLKVSGLSGTSFLGGSIPGFDPGSFALTNYGAYGGAADGDGNFWLFIGNTTQLLRVDHATLQVEKWVIPMANGYGITVDNKGRAWVCGERGLTRFDYTTQAFAENSAFVVGYNGCMTDGSGTIWVGGGGDGGMSAVTAFDEETLAMKQSIMVAAGAKGISIDYDGNVWGVARGNVASRVDPMTGQIDTFEHLNDAYSYSDMTGFGLRVAGVAPGPE